MMDTDLVRAAIDGQDQHMHQLLLRGASVNASDAHHVTALMHAAHNGHDEAVMVLLRHRANINAQDDRGMTALMYASARGHTGVVTAIVTHDADDPDMHARDSEGKTALIGTQALHQSESRVCSRESRPDHRLPAYGCGYTFMRSEVMHAKCEKLENTRSPPPDVQ
jgi:ankyrin repeat protein